MCLFAGLAWPSRGVGPLYVRAHVAMVQAVLPGRPLASGVTLVLLATRQQLAEAPWRATLFVQPPGGVPVAMPIDLRVLLFLPTAAFIALAAATPLASWKQNAKLLGIGLPILELLLVGLVLTPILSFLGGTGPIRAFELSRGTHTLLQIVYRALVAPPGMAFALPLLLWWLLLTKLERRQPSENRKPAFDFR